ncbi:MAG TPA: serine protease [Xanthobacteraceae bacterium]|nr:serine protease [Xanthobacteraceae bacterium]
MKAQTISALILATVVSLVTCAAGAAEPQSLGQPLPSIGMAGPATPAATWDDAVEALPGEVIRNALARRLADQGALATRGAQEIAIYRAAAPAVVLIVTFDNKLGSGSYLGNGLILTNWHVVGSSRMVGILFKPPTEGAPIDLDGLVRADVVKTDATHDLALLRLTMMPKGIKPLELGSPSEIQVGADVHAIGHPSGEAWTYTRGLISQIRNDFKWQGKDDPNKHRADVIQTQTPISPGNSGGPLIGDSGRILGVNSFKDTEGENLNFAISVVDIAPFVGALSAPAPATSVSPPAASAPAPKLARKAAVPPNCNAMVIYESKLDASWKKGQDYKVGIDTNCDNIADVVIVTPTDPKSPIVAYIDSNYDGKTDIIVEDLDRDGKWDISFYDTNYDGQIDLVGFHPDGKITASRYITYQQYLAYLASGGVAAADTRPRLARP